MHDEGGEAACWLGAVCDRCGALIEDVGEHRCRASAPPAAPDRPAPAAPDRVAPATSRHDDG